MQATATLATTTFSAPIDADDTLVTLRSLTGVSPGMNLFANRELMRVASLTGVGTQVIVMRGRDGTAGMPHTVNETVYIGQGAQFYEDDPQGQPPLAAAVSPWINIRLGRLWVIQGDDAGAGTTLRTWQQITTTQTIGSLGVRVNTTTTPS